MSTGSTGLPKAKAPLEKGSRQLEPLVVPSGIMRKRGKLHIPSSFLATTQAMRQAVMLALSQALPWPVRLTSAAQG